MRLLKTEFHRSALPAIICAALLILVGSATSAYGQSCQNVTDASLVDSIYGEIEKNAKLASQISHINVVSINRAVKLQGWTDSQSDYDDIVDIVLETDCVNLLNVNLFEPTPPASGSSLLSEGGCVKGTKPCGDVCIPENDSCNITGRTKN